MYVQKVDDEIEVADAAVDENLPRILIGRCKVLEAPRQVSTSRSAMDSPNQASQFNTMVLRLKHTAPTSKLLLKIAFQSPKTIRIVALPAPGIDAHDFHIPFSTPAEEFCSKRRCGIAGGDIARPA